MQNKYINGFRNSAKFIFFTVLTTTSINSLGLQDWPGENWQTALKLGALDDSFSNGDVSGAHWNDTTKTLWISDNKEEKIWSLVETENGFTITNSFIAKGDLEGITQATNDLILYALDENRYIRAYHALTGAEISTWKITNGLPDSGKKGKQGPEGITFIPDEWLRKSGFVDQQGRKYSASKYDLGGIFLIAHQNGGALYAFDLGHDSAAYFIGQYNSARAESSGLEFDRSTGILYISHNIDSNTLETTDLRSSVSNDHRKFVTKAEFIGPNSSNLEGFALKPAFNAGNKQNSSWFFYMDDNGNTPAGNAILVFKNINE